MIKKTNLIISIILTTLISCSSTETKQTSLVSENVPASPSQDKSSSADAAPQIEQKALQTLKQMSDALSASSAYTFNALTVKEQVLPSGQKLQYDTSILVKMQRPNALFVDQTSGGKKKAAWYHNTTFTLLDKKNNFYASTQTPDNTEDMLDFLMETQGVNFPLADFVFKNLYTNLIENVVSGFYVAEVEINGIQTHHLAFHQDNVDWQIWIDSKGQPVPRKFVITYNNKPSAPQFIAFFKDWDLTSRFKPNEFDYQPSKDAVKIEFYSKNNP